MTNCYKAEVNENEELQDYIVKIGIQDNCENTGKNIAEVGKRQKRCKLKELMLTEACGLPKRMD